MSKRILARSRSGWSAPRPLWLLLAGGVLSIAVLAPAQAQDNQQLFNRLNRLERDVQMLSSQVYRGGQAPSAATGPAPELTGSYATQVEVRLQEIERQMQLLTGRVEEIAYANEQLGSRLDRALNDIEFRLSTLEGGGGQPPTGDAGTAPQPQPPQQQQGVTAPAPAVSGATRSAENNSAAGTGPVSTEGTLGTLQMSQQGGAAAGQPQPAALPDGSVDAQYNYAYGLLAQGSYAEAESALKQFLANHPDSPLASNAQYWLGETYYIRGRFNDAAIAFAQGYQNYPQGAKAVDSLLKLGMSLSAMGQKEDACLTFSQLQSEFPQAPASIARRAAQERDRLQCG